VNFGIVIHQAEPSFMNSSFTRGQEYSDLLDNLGTAYTRVSPYLWVGVLPACSTWVLHVSILKHQFPSLLKQLLPILQADALCYRLPMDIDVHSRLLDGSAGYGQLGNILSIYPSDTTQAVSLVHALIPLTLPFNAPAIPRAYRLGGNVYTSHSSSPPDALSFSLPKGTTWPFNAIQRLLVTRTRKILNKTYLPYRILKSDSKGRVIKAITLKKITQIGWCLLKEGKKGLFADEQGRDIRDRLCWQRHLHQHLAGRLPVPHLLEFFTFQEDAFLALEYIDGCTLDQWQEDLYQGTTWIGLNRSRQVRVVDCLLSVLAVVQQLHREGFIHRDLTPANFLVGGKDNVYLIDLELTYDCHAQQPTPAFKLGTPGYISPEQQQQQRPTAQEDIYGLGGLLVATFTRLSPQRLEKKDSSVWINALLFFTGHEKMSSLIEQCLQDDPAQRPTLDLLLDAVQQFKQGLLHPFSNTNVPSCITPSSKNIRQLIQGGVNALAQPILLGPDKRWFSKSKITDTPFNNERYDITHFPGFQQGVSGVLFLLSVANRTGYAIDAALPAYQRAARWLIDRPAKDLLALPPGLYSGTAGIALAVASGIQAGLLLPHQSLLDFLVLCLDRPPCLYSFADGAAGQGIALLHCASSLPTAFTAHQLQRLITYLLSHQQSQGYWSTAAEPLAPAAWAAASLATGVAGIVGFLLTYLQHTRDASVLRSIQKGLRWLTNRISKYKKEPWQVHAESPFLQEGVAGIALSLLKASTVLADDRYLGMATELISVYPAAITHPDWSLDNGLTGLGEVYLEFYATTGDEDWKYRADWIVQVLLHTARQEGCSGRYWQVDSTSYSTADLGTGNAGILHFLLHYLHPNSRLLSPFSIAQFFSI
jgi:serine/threonine protein kinase